MEYSLEPTPTAHGPSSTKAILSLEPKNDKKIAPIVFMFSCHQAMHAKLSFMNAATEQSWKKRQMHSPEGPGARSPGALLCSAGGLSRLCQLLCVTFRS